MGTFELVRTMPGPLDRVFAAVGDLTAYGDYLPMTRIEADRGPVGPGWSFTGRTGAGPVVLVDRMQVVRWDPPHGFGVRKLGPVLAGWAEVHLTPEGEETRVVWQEHITLRPTRIGRHLAPVSDRVNSWLFGRALEAMADRVATG